MFCTPKYTSRRPLNASATVATEIAGGNRMTVASPPGVWRAANSATKSRAACGPLFIFQLPAMTGLPQLIASLLVIQDSHTRKRLSFEKLERCTTAGGDVRHLIGDAGTFNRSRSISAPDDGGSPLRSRICDGAGDPI